MGTIPNAIRTFIPAVFLFTCFHGSSRAESGDELLSRALYLSDLYNWPAAVPLFTRAEAIFAQNKDRRNALYAHLGTLRQADSKKPIALRSQEIADLLSSDPFLLSDRTLRLFALTVKGDLDGEIDTVAARRDWTEVQVLAHDLNVPKWNYRAQAQIGFADFYDGDLASSQRHGATALIEAIKAGDIGAQIFLASAFANGFQMKKMPAKAIEYANQAIALASRNPDAGYPQLAYASLLLSMTQIGKVSEAKELCERLLQQPIGSLAKANLFFVASQISQAEHNSPRAVSYLQQAIDYEKKEGEDRSVADFESSLSGLYRSIGDLSKAEELARKSIASFESSGNISDLPEHLNNLAQVLIAQNKYVEADQVYDQAAVIQDTMIGRADTALLKTALITGASSFYSGHFALIAEHFNNPGKAYTIVEQARGRIMTDLLVSGKSTSPKAVETETKVSQLRLQLMTAHSKRRIREIHDAIFLAEQSRFVDPEVTILGTKNFEPIAMQIVQSKLRNSEVIIEYVLAEPKSYCLVITNGSTRIVPLPGKQELETQVVRYLKQIKAKQWGQREAAALYDSLFGPVQETRVKHQLVIIPDGALHLLPFDALLDHHHKYVVESKTVTYAPSCTSFYLLRSNPIPFRYTAGLLAVGGVPYGHSGIKQDAQTRGYKPGLLSDLPGSLDEVIAAAHALSNASNKILTDRNATETAFKQAAARGYRYIHFAGHAFSDDDPDRAALVMLSDPHHGDDGFLQASEIVQMRLNADLVVLSACDTAVGTIQGEEGVSTLSNAFFLAGARTVVSTLWDIEDKPSLYLMKRFYQRIREHVSPSDSMAEAKVAMLRNFGRKALPAYWAGYIVQGSNALPVANHDLQ
jgi:CHAT domain-containing protein/tetratricopeptide (TPR) repeat protein